MEELWKPIEGYEGLYEVSNLGRVKSLIGWNGHKYVKRDKIMSITSCENHYDALSLHKDGKQYHVELHRVVAETWVPNPHNYPQVMHLDENKHNNRADNLRWGTAKENVNFPNCKMKQSKAAKKRIGSLTSFYGKKHTKETKEKMANYGKKVECEGVIFLTIKKCAEHYGIQPPTMRAWLLGRNNMPKEWRQKGLKYIDE